MRDEFERGVELFMAKNSDYGSSFEDVVRLYADNGVDPMLAVLPRIADKYGRIVNLTLTSGRSVEDESVLDTLRDLGAYCYMAAAVLR